MRLSKSKIKKAAYYLNDPNKVYELSRHILISELKDFGISVDTINSDFDIPTLIKIFEVVLVHIQNKHPEEVKACH